MLDCRVPCRNKSFETPLEVMSCQLIGSELIPSSLVKTLLYPGAIAKSLIAGSGLPNYHNLFEFYGFDEMKRSSFSTDIHHLEVCFFLSLILTISRSCLSHSTISRTVVCWELFMSSWSFTEHVQTKKNKLHWNAFDILGSYQRDCSIGLCSWLDKLAKKLGSCLPYAVSRIAFCISLHTKRRQEDHQVLQISLTHKRRLGFCFTNLDSKM